MIEAGKVLAHLLGVPIALGSDFCPNAHCLSMPFVMNLACIQLHLNPTEALVASTLNSAGVALLT